MKDPGRQNKNKGKKMKRIVSIMLALIIALTVMVGPASAVNAAPKDYSTDKAYVTILHASNGYFQYEVGWDKLKVYRVEVIPYYYFYRPVPMDLMKNSITFNPTCSTYVLRGGIYPEYLMNGGFYMVEATFYGRWDRIIGTAEAGCVYGRIP